MSREVKIGSDNIVKEAMQALNFMTGSGTNRSRDRQFTQPVPKNTGSDDIIINDERFSFYSDKSSVDNSLINTPKRIIQRTQSTPKIIARTSELSLEGDSFSSIQRLERNKYTQNREVDRSGGEDEEIKMVFLENRNLNEEINRLHIEIGKLKESQMYSETIDNEKDIEIMLLREVKERALNEVTFKEKEINEMQIEIKKLSDDKEKEKRNNAILREEIKFIHIIEREDKIRKNSVDIGKAQINIESIGITERQKRIHSEMEEKYSKMLENANFQIVNLKEELLKEKNESVVFQITNDQLKVDLEKTNQLVSEIKSSYSKSSNEQVQNLIELLNKQHEENEELAQVIFNMKNEFEQERNANIKEIQLERQNKQLTLELLEKEKKDFQNLTEFSGKTKSELQTKLDNLENEYKRQALLAEEEHKKAIELLSIDNSKRTSEEINKLKVEIIRVEEEYKKKIEVINLERSRANAEELSKLKSDYDQILQTVKLEKNAEISQKSEEFAKTVELLNIEKSKYNKSIENLKSAEKTILDLTTQLDNERKTSAAEYEAQKVKEYELHEINMTLKRNTAYLESELNKLRSTSLIKDERITKFLMDIEILQNALDDSLKKNKYNEMEAENLNNRMLSSERLFQERLKTQQLTTQQEKDKILQDLSNLTQRISIISEELADSQRLCKYYQSSLSKVQESFAAQETLQFSTKTQIEQLLQQVENQRFEIRELKEFNDSLIKLKGTERSPRKAASKEILEIEAMRVKNENEYLNFHSKLKDDNVSAVNKRMMSNEIKHNKFVTELNDWHRLMKRHNASKLRNLKNREARLTESSRGMVLLIQEAEQQVYEASVKDSYFLLYLIIIVLLVFFIEEAIRKVL